MARDDSPVVTQEHMQRAYAQLRRPDWPALDDMQRYTALYGVVRVRAVTMARGQTLPAEPTAAAAAPQGTTSLRANGQTERLQRRRDDTPRAQPFDHKRAAAGERPDDE